MSYPRAASRLPFKGANPAARQSRFRAISGWGTSLRINVCLSSHETTGLLRTEAMASRRGVGTDWGRLT